MASITTHFWQSSGTSMNHKSRRPYKSRSMHWQLCNSGEHAETQNKLCVSLATQASARLEYSWTRPHARAQASHPRRPAHGDLPTATRQACATRLVAAIWEIHTRRHCPNAKLLQHPAHTARPCSKSSIVAASATGEHRTVDQTQKAPTNQQHCSGRSSSRQHFRPRQQDARCSNWLQALHRAHIRMS